MPGSNYNPNKILSNDLIIKSEICDAAKLPVPLAVLSSIITEHICHYIKERSTAY